VILSRNKLRLDLWQNGKWYAKTDGAEQPDLTQTPGWEAIGEDLHERLIEVAEGFLHKVDPLSEECRKDNKTIPYFEGGFHALFLLSMCAPDKVNNLSLDDWKKWAPAIFHLSTDGYRKGEIADKLLQKVYALAKPEMQKLLRSKLKEEAKEMTNVFAHTRFESVWDDGLSSMLLDIAESFDLQPDCKAGVCSWIFLHGKSDDRLFDLIDSCLHQRKEGGEGLELAATVAEVLLRWQGDDGWKKLSPLFCDSEEFAKEAITRLAYRHSDAIATLSVENLVELYRLKERVIPKIKGASLGGSATPEKEAASFGNTISHYIKVKGTREAIGALYSLADEMGHGWLANVAVEARNIFLEKEWQPVKATDLLEYVEKEERSFVRSNAELCEVVLEELHNYQKRLKGELSLVNQLWNTDKDRLTYKNEEEISDSIAAYLRDRLDTRGIIISRNVDIRRRDETDIHVDVTGVDGASHILIVEVKGIWHPEVETAMETQLRDRYLKDNDRTDYGIYLVAWFPKEQISKGAKRDKVKKDSIENARARFELQARDLANGKAQLAAFVLDASRPKRM
jgi:hypothetical protein